MADIESGFESYRGDIRKIPGTGQNVVADALIGFAKGIAARAEEERKAKASQQNVAMQSLIQQGAVTPQAGTTMNFGGIPFTATPNQSKALEDEYRMSQIQYTAHKMAQDVDPIAEIEREVGDEITKVISSDAYKLLLFQDQQNGTKKADEFLEKETQRIRQRVLEGYSKSKFYQNVPTMADFLTKQTVTMVAPDGSEKEVPLDKVDYWISKGAKRKS